MSPASIPMRVAPGIGSRPAPWCSGSSDIEFIIGIAPGLSIDFGGSQLLALPSRTAGPLLPPGPPLDFGVPSCYEQLFVGVLDLFGPVGQGKSLSGARTIDLSGF